MTCRTVIASRAGVVGVSLALVGCLSQNPPIELRYFRPLLPDAVADPAPGEPRELRLDRVTAAPHLRERMVWRSSDIELGFDDVNLWIADPAALVEDALVRVLFLERGFAATDARDAPSLDVHVTAFEEVIGSSRSCEVELRVAYRAASDGPQRTRLIRREAPIGAPGPEAFVRAAGRALHAAALELADWLQ
jgi:uncharacterized lipoprotein YmbA